MLFIVEKRLRIGKYRTFRDDANILGKKKIDTNKLKNNNKNGGNIIKFVFKQVQLTQKVLKNCYFFIRELFFS